MRQEDLNDNEWHFLNLKHQETKRVMIRFYSRFVIIIFAISFITAFGKAARGDENPFGAGWFFGLTAILLLGFGLLVYIVYLFFDRNLIRDIRQRKKTIENCHVTRKQYMPQNNTWHFYIDSKRELSIQVSEADYDKAKVGDEVNIEYATHSGVLFGYY